MILKKWVNQTCFVRFGTESVALRNKVDKPGCNHKGKQIVLSVFLLPENNTTVPMVSWWLLSQETGVYQPAWSSSLSEDWKRTMSELSDALLPTPPLPVSRTFIQLLGCILKKKPIFWEFFGRSPNVSKLYLCEFSTADPNCWHPVSFFLQLVSKISHPPYQLVTKQSFPTKFGLGKTERESLVTSPNYFQVRASKAWYFETQISFSLRVSQDVKMQVFVVGKLRELELVYIMVCDSCRSGGLAWRYCWMKRWFFLVETKKGVCTSGNCFDLVWFPVAVNVGFVKHAWAFPKTTEPTMGSDRLTFYSFLSFKMQGCQFPTLEAFHGASDGKQRRELMFQHVSNQRQTGAL